MELSHSKLSCILNNPAEYYLKHVQGISLKEKKSALAIGSAVHWGIEHNTEDLSEYYELDFKTKDNYTREQLLSEAMVHGYLKHKDEIFEEILKDPETGEKLTLIEEIHELTLTGKLKSKKYVDHDFIGIIDLLLLTNKGFIIIDYKTSSYEPDWTHYQEQLFRYIFLLKSAFPDVPILKIGIINLRKTNIRQKKNENAEEFLRRMQFEYDINDEKYVVYHEYTAQDIDENFQKNYLENLSNMADTAQTIIDNKLYYINFTNANGQYGKSDFWDIFYKTPGAEVLYQIKDHIWNEELQQYQETRDCKAIDMKTLDNSFIINHYEDYKTYRDSYGNTDDFGKFLTDKELIRQYEITYKKEMEEKINAKL